jgi:methyl-accepting chemotaxis protein
MGVKGGKSMIKMYKNFKIRTKLIIGFFILAVLTATVGILGINNMGSMYRTSEEMYNVIFLPTTNLKQLEINLEQIRVYHVYALFDRAPEKFKERDDIITELVNTDNELLASFEKTIDTDEERALYDAVVADLKTYREARDANLALIEKENYTEALADVQVTTDARIKSDASVQALVDYNINMAEKHLEETQASYQALIRLMIIIITISVIVAAGLGIIIAGTISKPVSLVVDAADKLALGDVNVNVKYQSKDEIGKLVESFDKMTNNIRGQAHAAERIAGGDLTVDVEVKSENDLLGKKLSELVANNNDILSNIASASDQVATGSKQISDSSIALSHGATEQASSVEELTASLEEISSQTDLNAKNATTANELAVSAKKDAVQGNSQMKEMLTAMEDNNEASANISKVIKVIDDIAFQTNILALNAAVEAARAGQHGKGFAVVAEEVRNLAARSANAAKETTEMIEGSIKKAEGGTRIAQETAVALSKIVEGVEKVATLVNDIAIASNEQAMGISQINQGIMQVSTVVQTNSATSEEAAAASEELASQAELLKDTISRYKLKKATVNKFSADEISPEVMLMLEQMKKSSKAKTKSESFEERPASSKIILSDNEFGKY